MKLFQLPFPIMLGALMILCTEAAIADNRVRLEVVGASPGGGRLHVSFFDSEAAFRKREPCRVSSLDPESASVFFLFDLAEGDYLVSVFQDLDGDDSMDSGAFGLPIEPVGLSAWDGKGVPGDFMRHKLRLDAFHTSIQIRLFLLSARRTQGTGLIPGK